MGNSNRKCRNERHKEERSNVTREGQNYHSQFSLSSFVGNLSGRSFLSVASNRSTASSSRPWSRVSRRRWNNSTLSNPLAASKTAWPVPNVEALFLPDFQVACDTESRKFKVLGVISKGAFGKVYKAQKDGTGELFALKVLSKAQILSESAVQQVKDEVHIQGICGHNPFIVACPLKWQSRKRLYIVTEYMPGGELLNLIETYKCLPESLVQLYVAEIALVLDFLHNAGIVYRDLKPENLLLTEQGHIRLIDFGLSKWLKFGFRTNTLCGTLHYMAPEVLSREPYGHAVDWYSLGVVACRMLVNKYPDEGGGVPPCWPISSSARRLLERLLEGDPARRLRSLKALQETAFFKGFNFAQARALTAKPNTILAEHFPNGPPEAETILDQANTIFSQFDQLNFN